MMKAGFCVLHPSSSSPDLLDRWEVSTNDTEADTVSSATTNLLK